MNLQISVPKAGTHLFGLMTGCQTGIIGLKEKPQDEPLHQFVRLETLFLRMRDLNPAVNYRGHIPYHPELEIYIKKFEQVLLIVRDPRDIIVSWAYYVQALKTSALNMKLKHGNLSDLPFSARIDFLIEHIRPFLLSFNGWGAREYVHVFHYEDYQLRPEFITYQLSALGFGNAEEMRMRAQKREYTFRKGTINNWQTEFNDLQKQQAEKKFGDIIEAWRPQCLN